MSKKTLKIITIICTIVLVVCVGTSVFAVTDPGELDIDDTAASQFDTTGSTILGWIQGIGSLFAVGILMILGIKYMMGSASEKAEYKKTMIPYFIGAILLFAAVNIAGIVFTVSGQISNTNTNTSSVITTTELG